MTNTLPKLIEKIDLTDSGCWEWKGNLDRCGYGTTRWSGKQYGTHRLFYRLLVGEVTKGLDLDHLCRNRKCCNPAHLQPVTHKENIMRGAGAIRNRKTHCPKGHEYIDSNSIFSKKGIRRCLTCHRNSSREWDRKQRKDRL